MKSSLLAEADKVPDTTQSDSWWYDQRSSKTTIYVREEGQSAEEEPKCRIDLSYPMPDGRDLQEHTSLFNTVRELVFLVRDGGYLQVNAKGQKRYIEIAKQLAHAISLRGLDSFSQLTPEMVEEIISAASFGIDSLLHASERARALFSAFPDINAVPSNLLTSNKQGVRLSTKSVLLRCNLPIGVQQSRTFSAELSDLLDNWNEDEDAVIDRRMARKVEMTYQNVLAYEAILRSMYVFRHRLSEGGIQFDPFPDGISGDSMERGRESKPTKLVPYKLALLYMSECANFFVEQRDEIIEYFRALPTNVSVATSANIRAKLSRLGVACFVLLSIFSARRYTEILELERGCLSGDDSTGWWLEVVILKKRGARRKTKVPVPNLIARVVETLRDIGQVGQDFTEATPLFQYKFPTDPQPVKFAPRLLINDFAGEIGAREYANDNSPALWNWEPRQFRRFFSVLYFYRYKGSIESLSHHLRHYNIEQTLGYLKRDPDITKLWFEEEWGFKMHIATSIAADSMNYGGAMGVKYRKKKEAIFAKFHKVTRVVRADTARQLVRHMETKGYVLRPRLWVDCACPDAPQSACKAGCRRGHTFAEGEYGPDMKRATPSMCSKCPFAFRDELARQFGEAVAASGPGGDAADSSIIGEFAKRNVARLERLAA